MATVLGRQHCAVVDIAFGWWLVDSISGIGNIG